MSLFLESGYVSLNKVGEELCGDKVESVVCGDTKTLVLADGLGSGVKANILSTLTSKILCTMISNELSLEDCVETIIGSLPVCKVRNVAYSTFSIIHINSVGEGYLVEFDNPSALYVREGLCEDFEREELNILGKTVYKTKLQLKKDDVILIFSDGVMHAGIGKLLNFGWERDNIKQFVVDNYKKDMSPLCLSSLVASACKTLYMDMPGDDTTVASVKIREELKVSLLVGPPLHKAQDDYVVSCFMNEEGKKVVCGGTSSQIVARYLNTTIDTNLDYLDPEIPPIAKIKGIDLTTEGVLTLRKLLALAEIYASNSDVSPKYFDGKDGASMLADMLLEKATHIKFYIGQNVNIAHKGLPIDTTMKLKLVENISRILQSLGKVVELNYN